MKFNYEIYFYMYCTQRSKVCHANGDEKGISCSSIGADRYSVLDADILYRT